MANTKREVWDEAQAAGLGDMIASVSRVFGRDAIDGIAIKTPNGVFTTDDRLLHNPVRVQPGYKSEKGTATARKEIANKSSMRYKGQK